jgi:hypothetical protein
MSSPVGSIFAHGSTPPWLPRDVAEGRRFAWWAQILFFLMSAVWLIVAIVSLTVYGVNGRGSGLLALGAFGLLAMLISFMSGVFLKKTVIDAIDQGRFHDAKNDTLIWIIFGLIAFILPALMLILTYAKLGDALIAQQPPGYAPYAPGAVTVQQPVTPQYVPPPAPIQPPPEQAQAGQAQAQGQQPFHAHQTPMVRCKNCSVQYPTFMHSCPNCGAPKE